LYELLAIGSSKLEKPAAFCAAGGMVVVESAASQPCQVAVVVLSHCCNEEPAHYLIPEASIVALEIPIFDAT
jgi:hypothetical protein